jgi:hypothetical protein
MADDKFVCRKGVGEAKILVVPGGADMWTGICEGCIEVAEEIRVKECGPRTSEAKAWGCSHEPPCRTPEECGILSASGAPYRCTDCGAFHTAHERHRSPADRVSSDATPAPEKRGIDGESYTVRRFVLDHCAALGAEYEEDFRKDLLRMLAEVRAFEREACAQLFLGGGTYAGTDAAELIRSAKGGV